jgi:hypothetical protein
VHGPDDVSTPQVCRREQSVGDQIDAPRPLPPTDPQREIGRAAVAGDEIEGEAVTGSFALEPRFE